MHSLYQFFYYNFETLEVHCIKYRTRNFLIVVLISKENIGSIVFLDVKRVTDYIELSNVCLYLILFIVVLVL